MGKPNDQRLIYLLFKELVPFTRKTLILIINQQKNN